MFDIAKATPLGLRTAGWAAFGAGFLLLLVLVGFADAPISLWAQGWPAPIREIFALVTDLGLSEWYLVPALAFLVISWVLALVAPRPLVRRALRQMTGLWAFLFVGIGLPGLVANLIKRAVGRARPEFLEEIGALSFRNFLNDWTHQSFPSGHATTAFALCFVVSFLAPRWFAPMLLLAVLIAVSRVVVGAHYPTDVLTGALVGTLVAYLVRNTFAARGWVFRVAADGRIEARPLSAVRRLLQRSVRTSYWRRDSARVPPAGRP